MGWYWFGVNFVDNGFGYSGFYVFVGVKIWLFEDYFDGWWLMEVCGYVLFDWGGFFGNFGIEWIFLIDVVGVDIVFGVWGDYDLD